MNRVPVFGGCMNKIVIAGIAAALLGILACATEPEVRTAEVTREVPVVQEVPVTVQTIQTVEVTREVAATREVPVTVEVQQIVEVTRELEVTRPVPVTRIVTATPASTLVAAAEPTPEPASTIAPTIAPTVSPDPTPTAKPPETPTLRFGSWTLNPEEREYGHRTIIQFRNVAVEWEGADDPPVLIYECDGGYSRALYIDWNYALATSTSTVSRYEEDPFKQYRDLELDKLVDLADHLLRFVNDGKWDRKTAETRDDIWEDMERRWQLGPETSVGLVDRIRDRNHRSVVIRIDFFSEQRHPELRKKNWPLLHEGMGGIWVVLSDNRVQLNARALGELRRAYKESWPDTLFTEDPLRMAVATVKAPVQPAPVVAKWEVRGLLRVMSHCDVR